MNSQSTADVVIEPVLALGAYLKEQAAVQQRRPIAIRQHVPTYQELAVLTESDPVTIYRLTTPAFRSQLPLALGYRIIRTMRERDFAMGVGDLVTWEVPPESHHPPAGWQVRLQPNTTDRLAVILGPCLEICRRSMNGEVPYGSEIARTAQVSARQFARIIADEVQRLDLRKLGHVLTVLAQAGWGLTPDDVLLYSSTASPSLLPSSDTSENHV